MSRTGALNSFFSLEMGSNVISHDEPNYKKSLDKDLTYFCPICLTMYDRTEPPRPMRSSRPRHDSNNSEEKEDSDSKEYSEEKEELKEKEESESNYGTPPRKTPVILKNCNHMMCKECMALYCASKVRDGIIDVKCCHPVYDFDEMDHDALDYLNGRSSLARCCDAVVDERDIRDLLSDLDDGCGSGSMLSRYERFKFDALHGETLRRCPACDHPKIYDEKDIEEFSRDSLSGGGVSLSPVLKRSGSKINFWSLSRRRREVEEREAEMTVCGEVESCDQMMQIQVTDDEQISEVNTPLEDHFPALEPVAGSPEDTAHCPPSKSPVTTCTKCQTEFCYFHSNAHTGRSCLKYEEEQSIMTKKNSVYLRSKAKPCPKCGLHVQKSGGCNQMKCVKCGTYFCWLCLKRVDGGAFPAHYQWWNLNGCPNMQLNETVQPSRGVLIFSKAFAIVQIMFIGLPSVILATASSVACCCVFFSLGLTNRERALRCISFWGNCLTTILALPFVLVGCLISALLFIYSL